MQDIVHDLINVRYYITILDTGKDMVIDTNILRSGGERDVTRISNSVVI